MSIPATQMRPGMVIKHENNLCSVFSVEHRTPGNLRAFIQAKLRNLRTGAIFEHRFRSPDPIERVMVDEEKMEYLYTDGDFYTFMNTENYEQMQLGRDILGDAVEYLTPNLQITIEFFDGKAVGIELPDGRAEGDGDGAWDAQRDRQRRYQAGEAGNGAYSAGSCIHQRG